MALPQKNKNTKRANDWRRTLTKKQRRRSEARKVPTWESWYAQESRRLNVQEGGFRRDVPLDPSQVRDDRGINLLGSIFQWWDAQHLPWDLYDTQPTGPKVQAGRKTPLGRLQESARRFKQSRQPQPTPGPRPTPQPTQARRAPIISAPTSARSRSTGGLLSQYRRR